MVEVKVVGNASIPFESLRKYIETREGRDIDTRLVEADRKRLDKSGLFSDVKSFVDAAPKRGGYVVTFQVIERPVLRDVQFRGHKQIKLKDLEERSELKKDGRADQVKVMLAVGRIEQLYKEKGFDFAEIKIVEGGKPGDTRAIFQIFEGPKCKVTKVDFEGNVAVDSRMLSTKVRTGKNFLLLGGLYHAEDVEEDRGKLLDYYHGLGYFRASIDPVKRTGGTPGEYHLTFVVWEGPQFQVRNISFEGNKQIKTEVLRSGLVMHSGKPFSDAPAGGGQEVPRRALRRDRLHRRPDRAREEVRRRAQLEHHRHRLQDRRGRPVHPRPPQDPGEFADPRGRPAPGGRHGGARPGRAAEHDPREEV